ncbi:unnamed protein product [Caenorhabditis auriculariae]|uniref:glucuronosyltransferase n=1 Tax=Caenorhabditis auriculariae TaxID=2777116 RepID=A0A8S1H5M8_9PELO|nr:unnamed protein product [Caenorhabditis auriculariae]
MALQTVNKDKSLNRQQKVQGYKILVYNNLIGHSHVKFLSTLADTLTDAGHDVTVFFSVIDHTDNKTALKTTKKTIFASQNEDILPIFHNKDLKLKDYWTKEMGPVTMFNMFNEFKYGLSKQCERVLTDKQLLDRIRAEKFDIAVGEPFCECAFLFFEAIQVPDISSRPSLQQLSIMFRKLSGSPQLPVMSQEQRRLTRTK